MAINVKRTKTEKLKFPEHEKIEALHGRNNLIGNFIEWLKETHTIAEWIDNEDENAFEDRILVPSMIRTDELIAKYFEIDLNKLENEKTAMLDSIRANKK